MTLNDYKSQVEVFLKHVCSFKKETGKKIKHLECEFELLKDAIKNSDNEKTTHQIYDMIYLLLEIAVDKDCDLDKEWEKGAKRKQEKYLS